MSKVGKGSIGISVAEWRALELQYNQGFAFSSQWLKSFGVCDHEMPKKLTEAQIEKELGYAMAACASSVNIVRPIFGMQRKKSKTLSVSWNCKKNIKNQGIPFSISEGTSSNSIIYLDPTPIISKSDFTCHQRYDCVIGDGLLQSVKKNTIDKESFIFIKLLNSKGALSCVRVLQEENKNIVSIMSRDGMNNYNSYTVPEPFFFRYNIPTTDMCVEGPYLRFIQAIWTAVELLVAEKYLTKEFCGSKPYIYAHRNYYKKKRYLKNLTSVSSQIDIDRDTIAFLNLVYKILNPTSKYECHTFYRKFAKVVGGMLSFDINLTSRERLYNVICAVITGIYLLKKPGLFLRSIPEPTDNVPDNAVLDPFDPILTEEQANEIIKQIQQSADKKGASSEGTGKAEKADKTESDTPADSDSQNQDTADKADQQADEAAAAAKAKKAKEDIESKLDDLVSKMQEAGMPYNELGEQRKTPNTLKDSSVIDTENAHKEAIKSFYGDILGMMSFSPIDKTHYSDDICKKIELKNHDVIQSIQERLQVLSIMSVDPEYSLSSGALDENGLYKLYDKNEDLIFYRETIMNKANKSNITILMDQSGSMASGKNPRIRSLQIVAIVLAKALAHTESVNLKFYGHNNFNVFEYNPTEAYSALGNLNGSGNTNEGYAIADVVQRIVSNKQDDVSEFMFVLGDGEVDIAPSKKAFAFALSSGIQIFHIGLDDAYTNERGKSIYGDGRFAVLPMENLLNAFVSIFCQLLID